MEDNDSAHFCTECPLISKEPQKQNSIFSMLELERPLCLKHLLIHLKKDQVCLVWKSLYGNKTTPPSPSYFWIDVFEEIFWLVLLKNQTACFLEHQWMLLDGCRENRREWLLVAKWCWCWTTKRNKEYCGALKKISDVKNEVFAMPMQMSRFPNGLVPASYHFFFLHQSL